MYIGVLRMALEQTLSQQTVFVAQSKGQVKRIITQAGYKIEDFVVAKVEN